MKYRIFIGINSYAGIWFPSLLSWGKARAKVRKHIKQPWSNPQGRPGYVYIRTQHGDIVWQEDIQR